MNAAVTSQKEKRADSPDVVQQLIDWMTQKNPEDRPSYPVLLQTIGSLLGVSNTKTFVPIFTDSGRLAGAPKRRIAWIPAALMVIAIAMVGVFILLTRSAPREIPKAPQSLTRITTGAGLEDEASWSPDGKFLAYTADDRGNLDLRVLPLAGGQPIHIAESDADDAQPSWSPDGSRIAFVSARDQMGMLSIVLGQDIGQFLNAEGGDLFVAPAFGGASMRLIDNAYYPAWSPDNRQLAFQSNRDGHWDLWMIPAGGGQPRRITNDPEFDYQPSFSPDGKWIVYGHGKIPDFNLRVIRTGGGPPFDLTANRNSHILRPAFTPDMKFILYSLYNGQTTNIWKIPFSAENPGESNTPQRVTTGESDHINLSLLGNKIAYTSAGTTNDIFELTPATKAVRQVTFETSSEEFPHLSPDGKTLIIHSDRGGRQALWTVDLNGNILAQVTSGNEIANSPRFSPDGARIVYQIGSDIRASRVVIQQIGNAAVTEIVADGENPSWSPDGKQIALARVSANRGSIWVYALDTMKGKQLTFSTNDESWPTWSPSGDWIAFQSTEAAGRRHLWKVPSAGGTPKQLTADETEDSHPQWNPAKADEILFLRNHKNLFVLSESTGRVRQATSYRQSNVILDFPSWSFDGKTVYFNAQKKVGDIYVLENY
jgi:Tol biopolymer transport system component